MKTALCALIFAACFLPLRLCAQAWTLPEGGYEINLDLSRIDTKQEFNAMGMHESLYSLYPSFTQGEYVSTKVSLYAAYGVSDNFTLIGAASYINSVSTYISNDTNFNQFPNSGFGDIYLAGRLAILNGPVALAAQAGWKLPVADTGGPVAVALGDGQMDFDASVAAGYQIPIPGVPNHIQSKWGFLFRGGSFADAIIYKESLDAMLFQSAIGFRAVFDGQIAQGPVPIPDTTLPNTGFGIRTNITFSRLALGLIIPIRKKTDINIDWTTVTNGRGVFAGNTFSIGIAFHREQDSPLAP